MAEVRELTVQETPLIPAEVVENASTQSKLLIDIVKKTKCYQEIRGKKYLQVEAWETIGAFNRVHAETKEVKPIAKDGETIGYEAHVQLLRDGQVVGGAIMPCYFTENCCRGKHGEEIHKSCMSAAQTFATSKAYRMNFSYVAILAGYQPMPAEEITEDVKKDDGTGGEAMWTWEDIKKALNKLSWQTAGAWVVTQFPDAKGNTVKELFDSLIPEQQARFITKIQENLAEKGL